MFEFLLTAIWELFLQLLGELFLEAGIHSAGEPFRARTRTHPVMAAIGIVIAGALAGLVASLAWPARILQPGPVRGLSLIVSPIAAGILMDRYGRWSEEKGSEPSYLATFLGGALFAFSMALVRFLWVEA